MRVVHVIGYLIRSSNTTAGSILKAEVGKTARIAAPCYPRSDVDLGNAKAFRPYAGIEADRSRIHVSIASLLELTEPVVAETNCVDEGRAKHVHFADCVIRDVRRGHSK